MTTTENGARMIEQVLDHFTGDRPGNRGRAYPGAYQGLTPIQVYVVEAAQNGGDQSAGDVESPTGWFARVGKWVVVTDSFGFWNATKFDSEAKAVVAYEALDADYCEWADEGEDWDPEPDDTSQDERETRLGDFYDEVRDAELWGGTE